MSEVNEVSEPVIGANEQSKRSEVEGCGASERCESRNIASDQGALSKRGCHKALGFLSIYAIYEMFLRYYSFQNALLFANLLYHCSCPPARNLDSLTSGLVQYDNVLIIFWQKIVNQEVITIRGALFFLKQGRT